MQRASIAVVTCLLLAACSTEPQKTAESAPAAAPIAAPAIAAAATAPAETEAQRLERLAKLLAGKSVYFEYDQYTIKPEYQAVIQQDAEALRAVPQVAIRLEGNADERGSTEYNLALGQKRAEAVKRALEVVGVPEARVEAVSYGKEKPRASCHEERCWAENRRVDFAPAKAAGR